MTEDQKIVAFMLECIGKIRAYTGGSRDVFFNEPKTQDATIRALTMLTDVSKRLSTEAKAHMHDIPWSDVIGFRNYLVHEYLGDLDLEVVWIAIEHEVGKLESALRAYQEACI